MSRDSHSSTTAPYLCHVTHTLCMRKTLSTLFKRSDHCEDDDLDSDDSGSSSDDAADTFRAAETQLDIPDAHLGAQSTMNIHAVDGRTPQHLHPFFKTLLSFCFLGLLFDTPPAVLRCEFFALCATVRIEGGHEPGDHVKHPLPPTIK